MRAWSIVSSSPSIGHHTSSGFQSFCRSPTGRRSHSTCLMKSLWCAGMLKLGIGCGGGGGKGLVHNLLVQFFIRAAQKSIIRLPWGNLLFSSSWIEKMMSLDKCFCLKENILVSCEKILMADRPVVDMATHKEMVTWIAYSTPESRSKPTGLRSAAVFKIFRLMPSRQKLNKVVYREPELRLNQYAVQMHMDHVNNIMATLQLDSKEQHLERGMDPRNRPFMLC